MKKRIVITASVVLAVICFIAGWLFILHNNQVENYTLENIRNEYLKAGEAVVATVNDEPITDKDICLAKYSYHIANSIDKAIEQKAISQLADDDGFSLSQSELDKEINYIDGLYEKLDLPETEENIAFKNDLRENHLEMATSIKYQSYIEKQILNQEFSCTNEAINEKYEKYLSIYKEWVDGGKENSKLYEKIWSLREEIAQDYIDYRISQFDIIKV